MVGLRLHSRCESQKLTRGRKRGMPLRTAALGRCAMCYGLGENWVLMRGEALGFAELMRAGLRDQGSKDVISHESAPQGGVHPKINNISTALC